MSNYNSIVYDSATGRIVGGFVSPEPQDVSHYGPTIRTLRVENPDLYPDTHYVLGEKLTPRSASPVTLSGTTLRNVPIPAKVYINGTGYDTSDSTVELDLVQVGTYKIRVEAFPYLEVAFTVTV